MAHSSDSEGEIHSPEKDSKSTKRITDTSSDERKKVRKISETLTEEESAENVKRASKDYKRSKRSRSRSRSREKRRSKRRYHDLDKPEEEYARYYGEDKRENNDRYWSKYPKRDENVVGTRYYDEDKKDEKNKEPANQDKSVITPRQRKTVDLLTSKTGGAYIPPAKLRMMQAEITDKSSAAYQRIAWEALKKSIHGHINKINTSNIKIISFELLHENIVRGRGLLTKSIIQAQTASPTFSNVYAALVAIINSKFPNIGELLLKRLVLQFKRGFKQNNKVTCISAVTFVAHLVNQRVAHEILALEILTLLVESPTDDSVEVAIAFLKECGQKLTEVSSKGINAIFEMLRNILHEGQLEKRIQYMIEVMFQVRKDGFKDHAALIEDLDIVEEEEQFTHLITLDDVLANSSEDVLNVFKFDDKYEENEEKYRALSKEILEDSSSGESGESGSEEESDEDDDENAEEKATAGTIIDNTETNLIALRRTIYLTIQSSLDFEECAHKLMKMELKPGQEIELCHMFLDCCAEQRTYEKFYGLLAQRFCQINRIYVGPFEQIFKDTYATTHRLDANRLRNVSKFFAHLLFTDAIGWEVMDAVKLNEQDTNSSSRIFIKILFQELAEYMGMGKLNGRLKDETMQGAFSGLFPRDNPKNTRFAINFFTTIGLGGLTDELRVHLTNLPKNIEVTTVDSDSNSSSSSSSSSSNSSSSSSSDSSSSDDENNKKNSKKISKKNRVDKNRIDKTKVVLENKRNKDNERWKHDRGDNVNWEHDGEENERMGYNRGGRVNSSREMWHGGDREGRQEGADRERNISNHKEGRYSNNNEFSGDKRRNRYDDKLKRRQHVEDDGNEEVYRDSNTNRDGEERKRETKRRSRSRERSRYNKEDHVRENNHGKYDREEKKDGKYSREDKKQYSRSDRTEKYSRKDYSNPRESKNEDRYVEERSRDEKERHRRRS